MRQTKRSVPFEFVIEALEGLPVRTKPMFGCEGVYVGDKIVFALREKDTSLVDNGMWIGTSAEHHESLLKLFPSLRSIAMFRVQSSWLVLPSDGEDFESHALQVCDLVRAGDPRIGRPAGVRALRKKTPKAAKAKAKPAVRANAKPKAKVKVKAKPKLNTKRKPK